MKSEEQKIAPPWMKSRGEDKNYHQNTNIAVHKVFICKRKVISLKFCQKILNIAVRKLRDKRHKPFIL